ncbi:MAG TPA: Na+/H+ antiporter [Solirubrobacteraceae bacterium]|jgi:CPA1 family monovalent cation:H+ antiporter
MNEIELLLALLGVIAAIVWLAGKVNVPYPIFLLLAGIGIGFLPGLPDLTLDPDVIFLVFLPPLIHAAAWQSSPKSLKRNARTISVLAIALVGATMAVVAVVAHAIVSDLSWAAAFVLGAIVSPTDTVAATAIFRRIGVPERVVGLVEGESLINDGTSLVLYRTALAALTAGTFAVGEAALDLLVVGLGGALFGLGIAWLVREARRRIDDPLIEITVTLLTPYLAFLPAEELGLSGILAAVSSGLYLGWRQGLDLNPTTRLQALGFWGVLTFVLESLLFVLIGLQFPGTLDRLGGEATGTLIAAALGIALAATVVRMAFALTAVPLPVKERAVVGWAGMRGAVSLAAALAVPVEAPGQPLILFLTLTTIGITLVAQGLTLPYLIRVLRLEEEAPGMREKALARFRTTEAALAQIADLSFAEDSAPAQAVERAREMYTERARQLTGDCREGVPPRSQADVAAWTKLRKHLLGIERAALIELRDEGRISLTVVREVERDLDLEEERLMRTAPPRREPAERRPEPEVIA